MQLTGANKNQLLFSRNSTQFFEQMLTGTIILDYEHRFKDNPEFGKLLTCFWDGDISQKDRNIINKCAVTRSNVQRPYVRCYTCSTKREHNATSAGVFLKHDENTHSSVASDELPLDHIIVIEGNFHNTRKRNSLTFWWSIVNVKHI